MSLQQVNFYRDELKTQSLTYSAAMLLQLSLFLIIVFSAIAGFQTYQQQQQHLVLTVKQQQQKKMMANLQKLQAEFSKRQRDTTLSQRITNKTKELVNKKKVLGILSQDEFGNTIGFVEHISGLARQRIDGLWLTQIRIASGGTDVALHGITSKPALLPKYLQRLSKEKAFTGTEFKSLLMARQEKKKKWLNFSLQNIKSGGESQ